MYHHVIGKLNYFSIYYKFLISTIYSSIAFPVKGYRGAGA